ncbi:MAG: valine--tRNA ligase [Oscillospiraceae bacterium]|jgi:valyl-tRNA synthetase|nr:valine--tRNA ligase [Oscillospiraceae bacterium]
MRELPKTYDPRETEPRIYKRWLDGGYFTGVVDTAKPPFSIVIPPPNVTNQLHLGHALDNTLQDILTRWKRMQGFGVIWVPGTDHAGIATQIKVEEELRKEGKTRFDLGRDAFLERVWEWKRKYGSRIIEQLKLLGSSADWSRERFTMDDGCSAAVREVFVRLYEKGLIYQGNRIINWCPSCTTALSDAEVEHEERDGNLWHIRYPLSDGSGYLTVATTRPETMLGDSAVAVNPSDERYSHLVGKSVTLPLMNREIPIIADDYVEQDFGTGCVKITPCHDPNDFEVGLRHDLPQILVLDEHAHVINGGEYNGLERYEARKRILADLTALGLLERTETRSHNVGECYRCGTTVEPITSKQWFVKMAPLAEPAIEVVRDGRMKFVPERFSKTYLNWMENVRDWCISRQLWWGHQIPAWHCRDCGHVTVSRADPDKCEHCGNANIERDPDVLDTWFSSALWPFEVFGWPERTPELDYWYPTSVVCPGYEIIFFWVARMIFSGMEHMGDVPFRTAFIHGMVRDDQGRKMSKSLGNGVDPQEVIDAYGADALRMNIVVGTSPGSDMRFIPAKCESFRNFANKLWNAARFVLMQIDGKSTEWNPASFSELDRWILSKLNRVVGEVNANLEGFELGIAAEKLYSFVWDDFCDWYIEFSKARLNAGVLLFTLGEILKLLHPFMPFITEEIWQSLPLCTGDTDALMIQAYPIRDDAENFPDAEASTESLIRAVRAIRNLRAEKNVPPGKRSTVYVQGAQFDAAILTRLAFASEVVFAAPPNIAECVQATTEDCTLWLPLAELVDLDAERQRVAKERERTLAEIEKLRAKLANTEFIAKAPAAVVAAERSKLASAEALLTRLGE